MTLRENSILGEYGPDAIGLALQEDSSLEQLPSRMMIYRVLERRGALDGTHRQRRPAPPKGWHLPALAKGQAELDSFDFIEDLKIAGGPLVSVLTATSLHGALADAWVVEHPSAKATLEALTDRWRREGLPTYAQFDNDTIFHGAHQFTDTVGRVSRLCLALRVIPVFAPPREHGFQNAIEGFNALWQSKVLAAPPLPRPRKLGGRFRTLHHRLPRQNGCSTRSRPQPPPIPQRVQAQPQHPAQGSHDLPASKRRARQCASARSNLPCR